MLHYGAFSKCHHATSVAFHVGMYGAGCINPPFDDAHIVCLEHERIINTTSEELHGACEFLKLSMSGSLFLDMGAS
jgi:hypothetical protein